MKYKDIMPVLSSNQAVALAGNKLCSVCDNFHPDDDIDAIINVLSSVGATVIGRTKIIPNAGSHIGKVWGRKIK